MTSTLGHINIVTDDVQGTADFFVRNFDFKAGALAKLSAHWVSVLTRLPDASAEFIPLTSETEKVRIEVLQYIHPTSPPESPGTGVPNITGYRHIGFVVDDIDAKTADLKSQGFEFLSEPQTVADRNIRIVYFIGPEGILIELSQHL